MEVVENKNYIWMSRGDIKGFVVDVDGDILIGVSEHYYSIYTKPTQEQINTYERHKLNRTANGVVKRCKYTFFIDEKIYRYMLSEDFDDKWREDGCQYSDASFIFCKNDCKNERYICPNCINKPNGTIISINVCHYLAIKHRENVKLDRINYAKNKLISMGVDIFNDV